MIWTGAAMVVLDVVGGIDNCVGSMSFVSVSHVMCHCMLFEFCVLFLCVSDTMCAHV